MKKKTGLATLAGLALAASAFLKFSADLPITPLFPPEDIPPDDPADPIGTAAKQFCINKFGDLTYNQYQLKLLNLDIEFEEGRITKEEFGIQRALLRFCRARSVA